MGAGPVLTPVTVVYSVDHLPGFDQIPQEGTEVQVECPALDKTSLPNPKESLLLPQ